MVDSKKVSFCDVLLLFKSDLKFSLIILWSNLVPQQYYKELTIRKLDVLFIILLFLYLIFKILNRNDALSLLEIILILCSGI